MVTEWRQQYKAKTRQRQFAAFRKTDVSFYRFFKGSSSRQSLRQLVFWKSSITHRQSSTGGYVRWQSFCPWPTQSQFTSRSLWQLGIMATLCKELLCRAEPNCSRYSRSIRLLDIDLNYTWEGENIGEECVSERTVCNVEVCLWQFAQERVENQTGWSTWLMWWVIDDLSCNWFCKFVKLFLFWL